MHSTENAGRIVQINVNPRGGVPKYPVPHAVITANGVAGDKQRNRRFHGGPTRAVCLYALEQIEALRAEGHPIGPGSTGENLTIEGIVWGALRVGDRLRIGDLVELEIASYTVPCVKIAASLRDGTFMRMSQDRYPGWSRLYASVITSGKVHVGDLVTLYSMDREPKS